MNSTSLAASSSTLLVSTVNFHFTVCPLSVLKSLLVIAKVSPSAGCVRLNSPVLGTYVAISLEETASLLKLLLVVREMLSTRFSSVTVPVKTTVPEIFVSLSNSPLISLKFASGKVLLKSTCPFKDFAVGSVSAVGPAILGTGDWSSTRSIYNGIFTTVH